MLKFPKEILLEIKTHLLGEKERLLAQITDLSAQDPFSDTDRLTDNAASDAEANEETNHERYQAMVSELTGQKVAVEAALKRIEDGSYGFCINCKNLIDTDRLAAIPTALLCMDCEAKK